MEKVSTPLGPTGAVSRGGAHEYAPASMRSSVVAVSVAFFTLTACEPPFVERATQVTFAPKGDF